MELELYNPIRELFILVLLVVLSTFLFVFGCRYFIFGAQRNLFEKIRIDAKKST